MSAHQYWRLTGFLTDSNVLELSQAQLYDGVQLIAQAPTFTVPPTTGAAFPDVLRWDDFSMPGFALVWNLSTPVASPNLRLGAGSRADNFPKELYCQYSDDGQFWSTNNVPVNIEFPGAGLLTTKPGSGVAGGGSVGRTDVEFMFYRFKFLSSHHPSCAVVAEITASNGAVSVPLTGMEYTESMESLFGVPSAAFDGNNANYYGYRPPSLPAHIQVALDQPAKVTSFTIRSTNAQFTDADCSPRTFEIQGSNNDKDFVTLAEVTAEQTAGWALGETKTFAVLLPVGTVTPPVSVKPNYRYYKFNFKEANGGNAYFSVAEITPKNGKASISTAGKGVVSDKDDYLGASSHAFDEILTNYWGHTKSTLPITVRVDMGAPVEVSRFAIRNTGQSFADGITSPRTFDILGSNDDFSYTVIGSFADVPDWGLDQTKNFFVTVPNDAPLPVFIPLSGAPAAKRWRQFAKSLYGITGAPLPASNFSKTPPPAAFMDAYHGGRGIIRATVKRKNTPENTPLRRRVDLMDERSRLVIRSTWSDPATGIYAFVGIREDLVYTVVSYDLLHDKRAVIADNLTLANGGVELMP